MQTAKQHTMPHVALKTRQNSAGKSRASMSALRHPKLNVAYLGIIFALGFSGALRSIYHESPAAFYRGLGAVLFGIIPKMAVRFTSFEFYSSILKGPTEGNLPPGKVFFCMITIGTQYCIAEQDC